MSKTKNTNKVYGQTISFRYYANKSLKSRPYLLGGERLDTYPLYIQIKAKQQTSQRKSALNVYVVPERLDQFLLDKDADILTETDALRERILASKPFDNATFSLSQSLDGYSAFQEDVCYLIGEILREDYKEAREKDSVELMKSDPLYNLPELRTGLYSYGKKERESQLADQATDIFYRRKVNEIIEPIVVFGEVRDLAVSGKPHVKELYEKYGKHFWGLDRYCEFIRERDKISLISLSVFMSSEFRNTFKKYFKKEAYNSVYEGFETLVDNKSSLRKRLAGSSV